jgi:hypothetical protein
MFKNGMWIEKDQELPPSNIPERIDFHFICGIDEIKINIKNDQFSRKVVDQIWEILKNGIPIYISPQKSGGES